MALQQGGTTATEHEHQEQHPPRRRVSLATGQLAAGKSLLSGRGRLAGWSLLDTSQAAGPPAAATVLGGFLSAAGTLMTIPANTAWYGVINMLGEETTPAGTVTTTTGQAVVSAAVGLTPSGTLFGIGLTAPASTATGAGTVVADELSWGPGWIINSTAGALAVTMTNTLSQVDCSAVGTTTTYPGGTTQTVVELYDGANVGGQLLAVVEIPAGQSVAEALGDDGPDFGTGMFVNVVSGSVRGALWVLI